MYNCDDYYYPFAKLVDSNTVLKENSKPIKEMGIYIDVVPMDGYKSNNIPLMIKRNRFIKNMMVRRFRIKNCIRKDFDYMKFDNKKVRLKKLKGIVYSFIDKVSLPLGYTFWTKLFDKRIRKVSFEDAKYLGVKTGNFGVKETFKKEDIIDQAEYIFEGKKFTSFKNYDLYLSSKYGDYKKEPSESQKKSHHQIEAYWKRDYHE